MGPLEYWESGVRSDTSGTHPVPLSTPRTDPVLDLSARRRGDTHQHERREVAASRSGRTGTEPPLLPSAPVDLAAVASALGHDHPRIYLPDQESSLGQVSPALVVKGRSEDRPFAFPNLRLIP